MKTSNDSTSAGSLKPPTASGPATVPCRPASSKSSAPFAGLCAACFVLLALHAVAAPPTIDAPPRSLERILDQAAAFGVLASGAPPLSYQWHKDGAPILGATNDHIRLAHPRFTDAGRYSVVVSNRDGTTVSAPAQLAVKPPLAGDLDYSFDATVSRDLWGAAVGIQPDGKVLVAGDFTVLQGSVRGRIARLNPDGSLDCTFMDGMRGADGPVDVAWVLEDGRILIGGSFSTVNDLPRRGLARLRRDGSLDAGFRTAFDDYSAVHAVLVQSDGKVWVGGSGLPVNSNTRTTLVRLTPDGTLDRSVMHGPRSLGSYGGGVGSLLLQPDGKVLVAGQFAEINGFTRTNLARLNPDGLLDTTFNADLSGNPPWAGLESLALQPDGRILVAGSFTSINGMNRPGLARLNSDGSLDLEFHPPEFSSPDTPYLASVALQEDGSLLIKGWFDAWAQGNERQNLARLNSGGALDLSYSPPEGAWSSAPTIVQRDGKALVGLTRLLQDGSFDPGFRADPGGVSGHVTAVVPRSDGKVLFGGNVRSFPGRSDEYSSSIGRLAPDGSLDTGFKFTFLPEVDRFALGPQRNDRILAAGGLFRGKITGGGGPAAYSLFRRLAPDGANDVEFRGIQAPPEELAYVYAIALQPDGRAIVGGRFSSVQGVECTAIARFNPNGTIDSTFRGRVYGLVLSIAIQPDGRILVGGRFSEVGTSTQTVARNCLARLNRDGTPDVTFDAGLGASEASEVLSIALQSEGQFLVGGRFTVVGESTHTNLARLNPDGSLDKSFVAAVSGVDSEIDSIALQSNGEVLIGGVFDSVNGVPRRNVARLTSDGSVERSFLEKREGADGPVLSIAVQGDGKVLLGGNFNRINGQYSPGLVRLWGGSDVPPRFRQIERTASATRLTWDAVPGRRHRVQFATDLLAGAWTNLPEEVDGPPGGVASAEDTSTDERSYRFYRVLLLP